MIEHDSLVPDVDERARKRPIDPAAEAAAHEAASTDQAAVKRRAPLRASGVIGLQRTAGNAAVAGLLQRSVATEEQEAEGQVQASPVLDIVGKGGGQPLQPELKGEMESRLGEDFSDVRIHTDPAAAQSAAAVSAKAYTVGNEVVFGADSPALDSAQGKRTLAHELTHVIQQRSGPVEGTPTGDGIAVSDPSDRFEQAAEANAERVISDGATDTHAAPVQREAAEMDDDELTDDDEPVQGTWVQRAPAATDNAAKDEEDEEDEEDWEDEVATGDDFDDEMPVQGAWVQRAPTTATAPTATSTDPKAKKDGDGALGEALGDITVRDSWDQDVGTGTATKEGEKKIVVKDFKESDGAVGLSDSFPYTVVKADKKGLANLAFKGKRGGTVQFNAGSAIDVDLTPATVDDFKRDFNPEHIIQELTKASGEEHTPAEPKTSEESSTPTPTSEGSPEPKKSGKTAVDEESREKVLAALAKVDEFKEALEKVQKQVEMDWKQVEVGKATVKKVAIAFPAGCTGGLDADLVDQFNDQKIEITAGDTAGLSLKLKVSGGAFQASSILMYDVYKLYTDLKKAKTDQPKWKAGRTG